MIRIWIAPYVRVCMCVCVTRRTGSAHQLIPLRTKSQGGRKAGLLACLLQTKTSRMKAGKSASGSDNGNKTVEFTKELQGCRAVTQCSRCSKVTMRRVKQLLRPNRHSHCEMITSCPEFSHRSASLSQSLLTGGCASLPKTRHQQAQHKHDDGDITPQCAVLKRPQKGHKYTRNSTREQ